MTNLRTNLTPPDLRKPEPPAVEPRRRGLTLVLGIIAAMLVVNFTVTRPMAKRIDQLVQHAETAQAQLDALAGSRTDAWRTNDLLTALAIQSERLADAESTTDRVDELADALATVGRRTQDGFDAVDRLERLEAKIIAASSDVDSLLTSVEAMDTLHARVDELAKTTASRMDAVEAAQINLHELAALKDQLARQRPVIDEVAEVAAASEGLYAEILAAAPRIEPAAASAERMIALTARVGSDVADTSVATEAIDRLAETNEAVRDAAVRLAETQSIVVAEQAAIEAQLADSTTELGAALVESQKSLRTDLTASQSELAETLVAAQTQLAETLVRSQHELSAELNAGSEAIASDLTGSQSRLGGTIAGVIDEQSRQLASLIESSELVDDFYADLSTHLGQMQSIRRQLLELSLLERTFEKVATALKPLASLSDVRRLSSSEIQLAADSIRRTRATFDASPAIDNDVQIAEDSEIDTRRPVMTTRLVPEPIDGPVMR